jgi:hypothetical protein
MLSTGLSFPLRIGPRPLLAVWLIVVCAHLSGCSYLKPNLTVEGESQIAQKLSSLQDAPDSPTGSDFFTRFRSCYSPPSRVPALEARVRQLFVGFREVVIGAPVSFDPNWTGFQVRGSLDASSLVAIALNQPAEIPGCFEELVAFTPVSSDAAATLTSLQLRLGRVLESMTKRQSVTSPQSAMPNEVRG